MGGAAGPKPDGAAALAPHATGNGSGRAGQALAETAWPMGALQRLTSPGDGVDGRTLPTYLYLKWRVALLS